MKQKFHLEEKTFAQDNFTQKLMCNDDKER